MEVSLLCKRIIEHMTGVPYGSYNFIEQNGKMVRVEQEGKMIRVAPTPIPMWYYTPNGLRCQSTWSIPQFPSIGNVEKLNTAVDEFLKVATANEI